MLIILRCISLGILIFGLDYIILLSHHFLWKYIKMKMKAQNAHIVEQRASICILREIVSILIVKIALI